MILPGTSNEISALSVAV